MKKLFLFLVYLLSLGCISFWIVSKNRFYPQLRQEDVILNVGLTCLWLLIFSYLLSPVFRRILKGYNNLKEGKKVFTPAVGPKKKMTGLYKALLVFLGFGFLITVIDQTACSINPRLCQPDDFPLFIMTFSALLFGIGVPWSLYRLIQWAGILKSFYAKLVFVIVAIAGSAIKAIDFYSYGGFSWEFLLIEFSFLLSWAYFYLRALGFSKACYNAYLQFRKSQQEKKQNNILPMT